MRTFLEALSRYRKRLLIALLCLCLLSIPCVYGVHAVLVRQMLLPRLVIHTGCSVSSVAITPDGMTAFSGTATDLIKPFRYRRPADVLVWDVRSGRLLRRLPGCLRRSEAVTASPDGRHMAAISNFDTVFCWDWTTGQQTWTAGGQTPLAYSPDGKMIGVSNIVYDAATGAVIRKLATPIDPDSQTSFSPDGLQFAVVGALTPRKPDDDASRFYAATRLHLWQINTGKQVTELPFIRVRAFDISADGTWLVMTSDSSDVIAGNDGAVIRRINLAAGTVAWTQQFTDTADTVWDANSLALSPSGQYVVLQELDDQLLVLDARTGQEVFRTWTAQPRDLPFWAMPGGVAFSQDGKTLVSRCGNNVLVWDASRLK